MPFVAGSVVGTIRLNEAPAVEAVGRFNRAAEQATQQFQRNSRQMEGSLRGAMERVEDQIGRRSGFGKLLEVATGAGAVAGFAILGQQLAQATSKARELANAFAAGRLGGAELADQVARSVPVLGNFYSAARNVVALLTNDHSEEEFAARIHMAARSAERATASVKAYRDAAAALNQHTLSDWARTNGARNQVLGMLFGDQWAERAGAYADLNARAGALPSSKGASLQAKIKAYEYELAQLHYTHGGTIDERGHWKDLGWRPSAFASGADINEGTAVRIAIAAAAKELEDFQRQRQAVGVDAWLLKIKFALEDVHSAASKAAGPLERAWHWMGQWGGAAAKDRKFADDGKSTPRADLLGLEQAPKLAGLVRSGSAESLSAQYESRHTGGPDTAVALQRQQLEETKKQTQALDDMRREIAQQKAREVITW